MTRKEYILESKTEDGHWKSLYRSLNKDRIEELKNTFPMCRDKECRIRENEFTENTKKTDKNIYDKLLEDAYEKYQEIESTYVALKEYDTKRKYAVKGKKEMIIECIEYLKELRKNE